MRLREYDTNVTATLPIINSELKENIKLKELQIDRAELQYEMLLQREWTYFKVQFYQYAKAQQTLKLLNNEEQKMQDRYQQLLHLEKEGEILKSDVQKISLDLLDMSTQIKAQSILVKEKQNYIKNALNGELPQDFEAFLVLPNDYRIKYTESELKALWRKDNLDTKLIQQNRKLLEKELELKKQVYKPSLNLTFNSGLQGEDLQFNQQPFYATSALQLRWNLFNPKRKLEKEQMNILAKKSLLNKDLIISERSQQLSTFYQSIDLEKDRIHLRAEEVSYYKKRLSIIESQHREGKQTLINVHDAKMDLNSAEIAYTNSRFDFLVRCSELEQLLDFNILH